MSIHLGHDARHMKSRSAGGDRLTSNSFVVISRPFRVRSSGERVSNSHAVDSYHGGGEEGRPGSAGR